MRDRDIRSAQTQRSKEAQCRIRKRRGDVYYVKGGWSVIGGGAVADCRTTHGHGSCRPAVNKSSAPGIRSRGRNILRNGNLRGSIAGIVGFRESTSCKIPGCVADAGKRHMLIVEIPRELENSEGQRK